MGRLGVSGCESCEDEAVERLCAMVVLQQYIEVGFQQKTLMLNLQRRISDVISAGEDLRVKRAAHKIGD
jgi:hypothetical protein